MARAAGEKPSGKAKPPPRGTAAVLGQYLARAAAQSAAPPRAHLPRPTPERALSTAVARAALSSCGMQTYPVQMRITPATLAELPEILPERGLVMVVEDAHGRLGIVALCPALLASVIEMQSLGRVTRAPLRERRPTRTDASICADFVNAVLSELATEFAGLGGDGIATYRFASFVEDPKPLDLMLDEVAYRAMRLDMRLGQGGLRDGAVLIFLPDMAADIASPPARAGGDAHPAPAAAGRDLSQAMRGVPVAVNLVLCRRLLSLRELRALQTGSVLKLPSEVMTSVRLETEQGQLLAQGKLGALNGNRAIRIGGASGGRKAASVPDAALPVGAGNVFGDGLTADDGDTDPAPLELSLLAEPPMGDADAADPFRAGQKGDAEGEAEDIALPLNFIIE